jgi:hypothetical protein
VDDGLLAVAGSAAGTKSRCRGQSDWQTNLLLPGERFTAVELGQTPEARSCGSALLDTR